MALWRSRSMGGSQPAASRTCLCWWVRSVTGSFAVTHCSEVLVWTFIRPSFLVHKHRPCYNTKGQGISLLCAFNFLTILVETMFKIHFVAFAFSDLRCAGLCKWRSCLMAPVLSDLHWTIHVLSVNHV